MRKTETINPDFKKQWVEALRSGKFNQGNGKLLSVTSETKEYYCCLGVACIVAGVPKELVRENNYILEDIVIKYPMLKGINYVSTNSAILSAMNDGFKGTFNPKGEKHTFIEIADFIDKEL